MHTWSVYGDMSSASKAAAECLADLIDKNIKQKGLCSVVLPGGKTPAECLTYLADKPLDWEKVHWYVSDERSCPKGSDERNDMMLERHFWSKLSMTNIHPMQMELGVERAAEQYVQELSLFQSMDIAFLGMGEDGHTASLFPANKALHDTRLVIPIYNSPKPPSERVSLGMVALRHASHRIVLTGGTGKASAIRQIKNGEPLPINCLGDIHWFIDKSAVTSH